VASVVDDAADVVGQIFDEADRRDPNREGSWVMLVDCNNHQIDRIHTEAGTRGVKVGSWSTSSMWSNTRLRHEALGCIPR